MLGSEVWIWTRYKTPSINGILAMKIYLHAAGTATYVSGAKSR